jgi:hypothetical protein
MPAVTVDPPIKAFLPIRIVPPPEETLKTPLGSLPVPIST